MIYLCGFQGAFLDSEIVTAVNAAESLSDCTANPNPQLWEVSEWFTDQEKHLLGLLDSYVKGALSNLCPNSEIEHLRPTQDADRFCTLLASEVELAAAQGRDVDSFVLSHCSDCIKAYIELQSKGHSGALIALEQSIRQLEEDWPKQQCSGESAKLQQLLDAPLCKHIRQSKLESLTALGEIAQTSAAFHVVGYIQPLRLGSMHWLMQ